MKNKMNFADHWNNSCIESWNCHRRIWLDKFLLEFDTVDAENLPVILRKLQEIDTLYKEIYEILGKYKK